MEKLPSSKGTKESRRTPKKTKFVTAYIYGLTLGRTVGKSTGVKAAPIRYSAPILLFKTLRGTGKKTNGIANNYIVDKTTVAVEVVKDNSMVMGALFKKT